MYNCNCNNSFSIQTLCVSCLSWFSPSTCKLLLKLCYAENACNNVKCLVCLKSSIYLSTFRRLCKLWQKTIGFRDQIGSWPKILVKVLLVSVGNFWRQSYKINLCLKTGQSSYIFLYLLQFEIHCCTLWYKPGVAIIKLKGSSLAMFDIS